MKKIYQFLMVVVFCWLTLIMPLLSNAGIPTSSVPTKASSVKWTVKNPFEQKVFIENKGQYEVKDKISQSILFGARQQGLMYYFTNNSIWISHNVAIKRTEKEIEQLKGKLGEKENSKKEEDDKELQYKNVVEFHEMSFVDANPNATITADGEVKSYYNFALNNTESVKAQAWKKLTYKNLYPGIDMEFYFPEDKEGFKYVFIVHPGADASQIKINYPLTDKIDIIADSNISINSPYGAFIDHEPVAVVPGAATAVNCAFKLNNGIVQFNVGEYDKTKSLIIDPWTVTPAFNGGNSAFNVDWDYAGNSYVYGGEGAYQVLKYDNNGNMIWSYTGSLFYSPDYTDDYGDFTVDKKSGSVYLSQGFSTGGVAEIIKLNSSGAQAKIFPGNGSCDEFWRIAYSASANELIVAGAGTLQQQGEIFYMDTNFVSFHVVDAFGLVPNPGAAFYDIWDVTLDNSGNCYAAVAGHTNDPEGQNNPLVKIPLPTLTPTLWDRGSGYKFNEGGNGYISTETGNTGNSNAFNGLACSCTNLFTYDSYVLKKWSLDSGKILDSLEINGTSLENPYFGGIASDNFGNVFLGSVDSLKQYTYNLNLVNTIGLPGSIFDVSISDKNIVYVCGAGFLSAIEVNPPTYGITDTKAHVINPSSCVNPYGIAIVDSPVGLAQSAISWNTIPTQVGYSAVNLAAGTYIATIDLGCYGNVYDTVTIKTFGHEQFDTVPACIGQPVKLAGVPGESNYMWSPSTGLSSTSGASVIVTLSANATYFVTSTFNGCNDTSQINVVVNPTPSITVDPASASICDGMNASLTASGASSYQWSPTTGLNESIGSVVTANPSVNTTYTVTGIDTSSGCSSTASVDVNVGGQLKVSFNYSSPFQCEPQVIQLSNTTIGGDKYLWSFGDGSTDTAVNPTHTYSKAGSYTITLVAASVEGCVDSVSINDVIELGDKVTYVPNAFTPDAKSNNYFFPNVICNNPSGYSFQVYNRWGEIVYESSSPNQQGWDGRYNGELQPMDTYVYYIKFSCDGCNIFNKGDVTLLR